MPEKPPGEKLDPARTVSDDGEEAPRRAPLLYGSRLGRYVILDQLGGGGMGVVYKAYDPELDRSVAIKILSVEVDRGEPAARRSVRLLHEAQALAQLSHPNVIALHDVGTIDKDVFIAMELVEGLTLRAWLQQTRPSRQKTLEVLRAAGRGLAAAHRAGIVHRDFKPENTIVGTDERARVIDFGLARAVQPSFEPEQIPLPLGSPLSADATGELEQPGSAAERSMAQGERRPDSADMLLSNPLNQPGSIIGTPVYMAPEQHLGRETDARTDQFAFCVAVYEALYGRRPFSAKTRSELVEKVTHGRVDPPPPETKVPTRIRRILLRGLSLDPNDRYRSMEDLLDDLGRNPGIPRRWALLAAGATLLFCTAIFGFWHGLTHDPQLCQGARAKLAEVWSPATRRVVKKAFLASGRSHAADTYRRVESRLDAYANAWVSSYTEICEAAHVLGEQPQPLLDGRMLCLRRSLNRIRTLVELFRREPDGTAVDRAVEALVRLAGLEHCQNVTRLQDAWPLAEDSASRDRLQVLFERLDRAAAFEQAGTYQAGLDLVTGVLDEKDPSRQGRLHAEALFRLASLQDTLGQWRQAEQTLYEAIRAAAQAKDDQLVAESWIRLIRVVGHRSGRYEDALVLRAAAEAALLRGEDGARLQASLLNNVGTTAYHHGELRQARHHFERSLRIREEIYGPDHPFVACTLGKLGRLLLDQGDHRQAGQHLTRAHRILEHTWGSEHPNAGAALVGLGRLSLELGDTERAADQMMGALKLQEETLGEYHPQLVDALEGLAELNLARRRFDLARRYYRRALTLCEKHYGPRHLTVVRQQEGLGRVELAQKKYRQACGAFERAWAALDSIVGSDHPRRASVLTGLGECTLGMRRPAKAIDPLERALRMRLAARGDPVATGLAATRFALARALWDTESDRRRSVRLAQKARENYVTSQVKRSAEQLVRVESWLGQRAPKRGAARLEQP